VTEQRYKAVLAVIGDGRTVDEVARDWGVSRRTMHRWLARYEGDGLEGLNNRSHRPAHCPHQTSPAVEAMVLEMRRAHSYWGARRIALELARKRVEPAPSESAVYRCLVRTAVIDPMTRRRRRETWTKRRPMTLLNFMVPVWLRRVGLPDSMPNDWTWQQGDVSFRLDAPQSKGERAQSLVSWTRSWEITETIAGPGGAQPPECNWDGKETSSGRVA